MDIPPVDAQNCCLQCLRTGIKTVETLRHMVFDCNFYNGSRAYVTAELARGDDVFELHRGKWSWSELRRILRFMSELARSRFADRAAETQADVDSIW